MNVSKYILMAILALTLIANYLKGNAQFSKDVSDLVDVSKVNPNIKIDMRYATKNNFTKQVLYLSPKCYLRKNVAEKLDKIQKELEKKDLCLKILDAYRPLSAQKKMWEIFPDTNFVADPKKGSKHNRGASVDVTLFDLKTGKELPMPTKFDDLTERAAVTYNKGLTVKQKQNRNLLQKVMKENGFLPYKNEWWHFNDSEWQNYALLDVDFKDLI
ncbi:MAG: M15 family metallopeptidase [bacterium]